MAREDEVAPRSSMMPKILAGLAALLLVAVVIVAAIVVAVVISSKKTVGGATEEMAQREVPTGVGPAWIEDNGDTFAVGQRLPCPASAVCLDEAGLGDVGALGLLDGLPTAGGSARQLRTYVACAQFLEDAGGVLGHWQPSDATSHPSSCLHIFPADRPWSVGLEGSPSPLELPGDDPLSGHYRMSSFARDIVEAVAEGSRSWTLLMDGQADPMTDLYRVRLAAGMELALASGSLDDIDRLPEALGEVLRGGQSISVRLPSDPMVAFDGAGPFAIGSAFRRELNALADLAVRRGSIHYQLCVVSQSRVTKAHPEPQAWNIQRLDYLQEALSDSGHRDRLAVCPSSLTLTDSEPLGDDDPCDPYREALTSQTLLLMSSDLL